MRILILGLDNSILDKESRLAKRAVEYGELVEKYIVVVPAKKNEVVKLSDNVLAYGIESKSKIKGLIGIYFLGSKLIKKENFDIISAQDQYYLGFVALKLARKFRLGLEIQVHGFEKFRGLRKLIAKYILPKANAVRVVSKRLKKKLIGEFNIKEEVITVVSIHLELQTSNNELPIKDIKDKFIFLTVGRLVAVKNIDMQIRAMKEVVKKYPRSELWIVGEGKERSNYELQIINYKLQNNIKLLGWHENLEKFFLESDIFMLTSDSEGWGLVIIMAANYGLPIIMTDVGCAGEVIKNRESGIVISVGNQRKLEEAMIELIEDKELRGALGENASFAVKKLLSKKEVMELYKKSWQKVIKNKNERTRK